MSTNNQKIRCKAAVAWSAGGRLRIDEIEVDPPREDEVRIKILYTGICHTDYYTLSGDDPEGDFPSILGHEGGGIVESVGEGVTEVKPGDHVIPLYTAECRECELMVRETQGKGLMPDGSVRFHIDGKPIKHFMGCSTFSQYTVVSKFSVVKVVEEAQLDKVCLLGCGITTGFGAATKTANVPEGSTVAVFGVGCVGLAVIQGCHSRGCKSIVAVDTNPGKETWAKKMGATHFVNPTSVEDLHASLVNDYSDGGFDYTFDCTGNVGVMRTALEACHKGWGVSTIIGVAAAGKEISTRPLQLVTGRKWQGSAFGGVKGRTEIPGIVDKYLKGEFKVDEYITHQRELSSINEGFDDMKKGECIRCVVDMWK
ncbi:S-glutathione dehydrogenase [Phakopsora pachyrhizi]|uniref:S-glutathione dehydrogenase n=1 Tax=Phakopsora pachyrhizi TaxID=170000 RepID=A0AAV0B5U5_PHAPC|nr:S-glutathione dehydrogenase [Phakopsora pachyrhizi]CAH7678477.1 S-glutathione dehydrogenase [Phakopsora pachyrhizi]